MPILSLEMDRRGYVLAYGINSDYKTDSTIQIEIDQQTADQVTREKWKELMDILHGIYLRNWK